MIEISSAWAAAKATFDLAKVALDARDEAKVRAAIAELQAKYQELVISGYSMQEKLYGLNALLLESTAKNSELERQIEERASYVLHEVKPGAFCYRFEPKPGSVTPAHYVCQPCYDKGVKSVLRLYEGDENSPRRWVCVDGPSSHEI